MTWAGYLIFALGALMILGLIGATLKRQMENQKIRRPEEEPMIHPNPPSSPVNTPFEPEQETQPQEAPHSSPFTRPEPDTRGPSAFKSSSEEEQLDLFDFEQNEEHFEPIEETDEPASAPSWTQKVRETFQARTREPASSAPESQPENERSVIVVNVVAPRGHVFYGYDLAHAFEQLSLFHGDMQIFHAYDEQGETLFSVASVIEPGYFDPQYMDRCITPGVALFLDLTRVAEPKSTFKHMLTVAYDLAQMLGGDVLDHRRERLTQAGIAEYLAQIRGVETRRKYQYA